VQGVTQNRGGGGRGGGGGGGGGEIIAPGHERGLGTNHSEDVGVASEIGFLKLSKKKKKPGGRGQKRTECAQDHTGEVSRHKITDML